MENPVKTAIGLMSGTSMDGIDLAVIQTDGERYLSRGLGSTFLPYDEDTRSRLAQCLEDAKAVGNRNDRPGSLKAVEQELTELNAAIVQGFLDDPANDAFQPDLIGYHGQTVLHRPDEGVTVQLGDGALLSHLTGLPVAWDLRANDMVHGGQGAPLAPAYHGALATKIAAIDPGVAPVVFVNIGGISNVTYVGHEDLVAFDTGPGNVLMDWWVQDHYDAKYDQGGLIASKGRPVARIVEHYLRDAYLQKEPPKSLDRLDFSPHVLVNEDPADVLRSLARVTAECIIMAANHFPAKPALWVLCGGGRHNKCIIEDMMELASAEGSKAVTAEEVGLPGDDIEAEAWAYLAVRAERGLALTYPKTTGCSKPVSGGRFSGFEGKRVA